MKSLQPVPYENVPEITDFLDLLNLGATYNPNKIAFKYLGGEISFANFRNQVLAVATDLGKKYSNEHIALIGENSIEWLKLFFAIVVSDNVAVVIDKDETPEKISAMLKTSRTKTVFCSEKYLEKLKKLPKGTNVSSFEKILKKKLSLAKVILAKFSGNTKDPILDPEKPAVIFFTSGTTGANKAVLLSQKNICRDIYGAASIYRPSGGTVSFLPFHHAFGLVTAILMPFYYGCTTYLTSSLKNVARDIREHSPQTIFVVPAVLELFYRQIWREARKSGRETALKAAVALNRGANKLGLDYSKKFFRDIHENFGGKLGVIICGGAYLDPKYIKWFRAIGIEVLNGYGITECSPVVAVNRQKMSRDGSVGQICRDVKVKIARDKEILVQGDIVMQGYYGDKKSTDAAIKRGWFHTGDLGYVDKDGFLFITGRKKDLIILSNGENISPEGIEAEFLHQKSVQECIVYAKDNQLVAEIFPAEGYRGNQAHFDKIVYNYNKNQPRNHQISVVKLRETEFVKNNNTKILRNKIGKENGEK